VLTGLKKEFVGQTKKNFRIGTFSGGRASPRHVRRSRVYKKEADIEKLHLSKDPFA
jgi:hypothetical protein